MSSVNHRDKAQTARKVRLRCPYMKSAYHLNKREELIRREEMEITFQLNAVMMPILPLRTSDYYPISWSRTKTCHVAKLTPEEWGQGQPTLLATSIHSKFLSTLCLGSGTRYWSDSMTWWWQMNIHQQYSCKERLKLNRLKSPRATWRCDTFQLLMMSS